VKTSVLLSSSRAVEGSPIGSPFAGPLATPDAPDVFDGTDASDHEEQKLAER